MILLLDHIQRMNVSGLLGSQKATVSEMRTYWRLLDMLELSEPEKAEIEYYEADQTHPLPGWNPLKSLPPREFTFSDAEGLLVTKAIDGFPQFTAGADRRWLEPLLAQLPANGNGHK
jgi:hypothetical protein